MYYIAYGYATSPKMFAPTYRDNNYTESQSRRLAIAIVHLIRFVTQFSVHLHGAEQGKSAL